MSKIKPEKIPTNQKSIISEDFFLQKETLQLAKDLIGCILVHESSEGKTAGVIIETEAYLSSNDPACHASRGKTKRNEAMFENPGSAYVYLIYGNHFCFNVVTNEKGIGEAVLIRALEPIKGIELMKKRRSPKEKLEELASGPGKLCKAMGITKAHDKTSLLRPPLYLIYGKNFSEEEISKSKRIGISKAKDKPWRFFVKNNRFISR